MNKGSTPSLPGFNSQHSLQSGYYSGDKPNPNLRAIVEQWYSPHLKEDAYTIDTHVPPITTERSTPLYLMHSYWSKKPHAAVRAYIEHFTKTGDIVLDPFSGTGGTAISALTLGRKAVAIDISPAATFITRGYCTPVDVSKVKKHFDRILRELRNEFGWLYETRTQQGLPARILSVQTSMKFQCPKCLNEVSLLSCASDGTEKVCPVSGCGEKIRSTGKKLGYKDDYIEYTTRTGRRKEGIKAFPTDHNSFDQSLLKRIHDYPAPQLALDFRFPEKARIQSFPARGVHTLRDLYSPRNWVAMNVLRDKILGCKEEDVRYALLLLFTSICIKTSRCLGLNSDGVGRVQKHGLSPQLIALDVNVFDYFEVAWTSVAKGWREINNTIASSELVISTQDARNLSQIPPNSIDYVFTDPAYGDRVQFWESNLLWELWLEFDHRWSENEIVVNRIRGLTSDDWSDGLAKCMRECFRVLKPGRWVTLAYNDDDVTWSLLQNLMLDAGFVPDKSDSAIWMETITKSEKQMKKEDNTRRDLVINFRKPTSSELPDVTLGTIDPKVGDKPFKERMAELILGYLDEFPGARKGDIRDFVISRLVRSGALEPHEFDGVLENIAETNADGGDSWFPKEEFTSESVSQVESQLEAHAAATIERYIQQEMEKHPATNGIPYAVIVELYLYSIKDKPRKRLIDILAEWFVRTPEGTWRSPCDERERSQLAALREAGTLRHIKRFANALLNNVRIRDADKPGSDRDLCQWIAFCRRAGLYSQGRAMYELGGLNLGVLSEAEQIEVEDDYRICVKRGSEEDGPKKTKGSKKK